MSTLDDDRKLAQEATSLDREHEATAIVRDIMDRLRKRVDRMDTLGARLLARCAEVEKLRAGVLSIKAMLKSQETQPDIESNMNELEALCDQVLA